MTGVLRGEKWGSGGLPPEKFRKPRPSYCGEMIPRLIIMLKPNKIPRLKLSIAIIFYLTTFLLKILQRDNESDEASQPKRTLVNKILSVPFLPTDFSFQDHYLNFQYDF